MAELIKPMDDFKNHLIEKCNYDFIDFGNGLLVIFTGDDVNIRQYHSDGACLSSWISQKDFFKKINHYKEELDNEF